MKGRTIFDAVITISDIMDYTEVKGYEGIMSAIDFEMAVDSLSWDFLFKSLELFGFCVSFIFTGTQRWFPPKYIKGAVSRQSSSFCLIFPITRPQSLWNLK